MKVDFIHLASSMTIAFIVTTPFMFFFTDTAEEIIALVITFIVLATIIYRVTIEDGDTPENK